MAGQTPSQTVGPFFHLGLIAGGENNLVQDQTRGRRILIRGTVLDGDGQPVPDAMLETWQADAQGIFRHPADPLHQQADPHFHGFGRAATDDAGRYWIKTIKPGAVERPGMEPHAPHLELRIFARGMLIHALTRLYFDDEPGNANDRVLNSISDPARRQTLIARFEAGQDLPTYGFNIVLQGESETVFFDPLQ
jgi:protocatechuate 3,4-dioxygenase alpha subunit